MSDMKKLISDLYSDYWPNVSLSYDHLTNFESLIPCHVDEHDLKIGFEHAKRWWNNLIDYGEVKSWEVPEFCAIVPFVVDASRSRVIYQRNLDFDQEEQLQNRLQEARELKRQIVPEYKMDENGNVEVYDREGASDTDGY